MKKNVEIMGRKVSVMAIVIALLVISTASAATYRHYATMQGDVAINSPVHIIIGGHTIPLGGTYDLTIEGVMSPCTISETFQFNNSYGSPIDVSILWILYEDRIGVLPLNASTSYWIYGNETLSVPTGISTFNNASLDVPAYMIGPHIFSIAVNPVY